MGQDKINKLELTWIGKEEKPFAIEPRLLIETPEYNYGEVETGTLPNGKPWPGNMLIHGDNLLALRALEQDFAGQIKCIYIDPPYNTGSAFHKYDDGIEHSIWLGLMQRRLMLLHKLLKDDGIIFVSIDDHEVAYLQVLLDEIFGRKNFLVNIPTVMNLKGNQDQFGFAGCHEYTLVYAKDKSKVQIYKFAIDDDLVAKEWNMDNIGLYKKGATLKSTGEESLREDRPRMFYPILVKDSKFYCISDEEYNNLYNSNLNIFDDNFLNSLRSNYQNKGFTVVLPYKEPQVFGRWRWGFDTYKSNFSTELIASKGRTGISIYKKQRPELGEIPTSKPKSIFYKPEYSSGNGTAQIKQLFGYNAFPYPKPEDLISDIITIGTSENDIVLDSFLGSGTTAAVAHKMGRRWIGVELGDHAYTHCAVRMQKVVDGEQGGISKSQNWKGGGGFKFYELAPSLLNHDKYGNLVINKEYNADMLAAAMAKHQGFTYSPDEEIYWKQGQSTEHDFIFTTTQLITAETLESIHDQLDENESLLICCTKFQPECRNKFPNITIKKIPKVLLDTCEFDHDDYSLNIVSVPEINDDEWSDPEPESEYLPEEASQDELTLFD